MHEYSVVKSLLDICKENVLKENCSKITKIVVAIGTLSGIEIELFKRAFETFKEDSICSSAKLVVEVKELKLECQKCKNLFSPKEYEFICQNCGSCEIKIVSGKEMHLINLSME